ncbi:25S rRNA (adenine2142-N1)-methyltransferase [Cryptotrichosporon argae]
MPRAKRVRKHPIVSSAKAPVTAAVSSKVTQSTISRFHTLLKRRARLERELVSAEARGGGGAGRPGSGWGGGGSVRAGGSEAVVRGGTGAAELRAELAGVAAEMDGLGGLEAYQAASVLGQSGERGGDSSKVLVSWLRELGRAPPPLDRKGKQPERLRMLEIGALKPDNYASCSTWIDNSPLDLHARHPDILEQDFLLRPVPGTDAERHDIVSCSLVLNFVADAAERGRMLQLCRAQLRQAPSSLLFIVLPTPCVANSRYTTPASFAALVRSLGFELRHERTRAGGKVSYWLWAWRKRTPADADAARDWAAKRVLADGPKRNNFAIVLKDDT